MPLQLSSWMRLTPSDHLDWEGDLEVGPLFLCVDSPGYHSYIILLFNLRQKSLLKLACLLIVMCILQLR